MEHHITCSSMDPLQWMGAVKIRVPTAKKKKNSTSNQHNSSPSLNILWSKKLHVCKKRKYIIMAFYLNNTIVHNNTSQDINWWSDLDYCDIFISCLNSHSDGTHSLPISAHFQFWVNYSFKATRILSVKFFDCWFMYSIYPSDERIFDTMSIAFCNLKLVQLKTYTIYDNDIIDQLGRRWNDSVNELFPCLGKCKQARCL